MVDYSMDFLMELDKLNMRTQYVRIVLLSFDEKPETEIQGNITTGSLTVNGSSTTRRTINLTMLASYENANIEDIDNQISINKKIKVYVGYDNPLKNYKHYGDVVWFPCGLFIVSTATVTRNTTGWSIAITGKDKMCLLDGTVGGTIPASTTFNESLIINSDGDITKTYPTIFKIIYEAVNHFGGELIENIIISDLDEDVKKLVRYKGEDPLHFSKNYSSFNFQYDPEDFPNTITYGEDAGYQSTSFTYPGDLILKAGDTVKTLLDKIVQTLGNFEYFYDLDGRFIFQQIKNYLNITSPILELSSKDYVRSYNNAKFLYSLTDLDTTTAVVRSPKFDNVKNDFYVWGQKTTDNSVKVDIRYHLVIDEKPRELNFANKYMWLIYSEGEDDDLYLRYEFTDDNIAPAAGSYKTKLVSVPSTEWREELYRRALVAQTTNSQYDAYYDAELIAEWRKLYDPMKEEWRNSTYKTSEGMTISSPGWNPAVFEDPKSINFWLDFIDEGSQIGKYSIKQIGRRTKVTNNTKIKSVYTKEVPDIIFLDGYNEELITKYTNYGQQYFVLTPEFYNMFEMSSTGVSCFDQIRELIYQNLSYNTTIQITCLPKYYMEPNNIIYIEDKDSGIKGNYLITQFTLPLAYNGTMSITATEVLARI